MNITKEGDEQSDGKLIMMQRTVEHLNKTNPKMLKELERGPKFEVGGTAASGFYYTWDLEDNTKYRKLLDGRNVEELDEPLDLSVITKCPEKWILQDVETGQIFQGTQNTEVGKQWKEITIINDEPNRRT
jgi:hypothetical protein|tara:strand:- start:307 stop:696 length:390 start_codon:yes stop_codon:yes gene_type:complete